MKNLYVLRHAKSDWADGTIDDFERRLAPRGVRAAGDIGRFLARIDEVPDHVVVSAAARAVETLAIAAREGDWSSEVVQDRGLYGASCATLLSRLRDVPDVAASALVVAHEPGLSDFIGRMIGRARVRVPTAALARIEVPITSWRDLEPGSGTLHWLVAPRTLAAFKGADSQA